MKKEASVPSNRSRSGSDTSSTESRYTKTPSPPSIHATSPAASHSSLYRPSTSYLPDAFAAAPARKYSSYRDPTPPEPLSPATPLFGNSPYSSDYFSASRNLPPPTRSRRNSFTSLPPPSVLGNSTPFGDQLFPRTTSPLISSSRTSTSSERFLPASCGGPGFNLPPVSALIPDVDRMTFGRSQNSPYKAAPYKSWF
jgi:hypothetical protein